jgi:multiple sugar transport system permease protein
LNRQAHSQVLLGGNKKRLSKINFTPYLFLAAATVFMVATIAYPFVDTLRLSLYQSNPTRPDLGEQFIGLRNFVNVLTDVTFWTVLLRTVAWTTVSVGAKVLIGLSAAFLLYRKFRGRRVYQALIFVPWVTPAVVGAVSWKWIYDGQNGMLNYALVQLGVLSEPYSWLGNTTSAFFAVVAVDIWWGIPLMTILLIAGLRAIPPETLEAAAVDGASGWTRIRYITLPQLLPVIVTSSVLSLIWTFNSFPIIWAMTKGGPAGATETLVIKTYQEFFGSFNLGVGATYAVIALAILLVISILYTRTLSSEEGL